MINKAVLHSTTNYTTTTITINMSWGIDLSNDDSDGMDGVVVV